MTLRTMMTKRDRPLVWLLPALLASWFVLAPMAAAQPRMPSGPPLPALMTGVWFGDPARDPIMVNAHAGFGGNAIASRWTPMRVTIASTSLEGYEGLLRLRVSEEASISVYEAPFALPPMSERSSRRETTTVFIGFVAAAQYSSNFVIDLEVIGRPLGTTQRATILQRAIFEHTPSRRSLSPPSLQEAIDPMVLLVGQSSASGMVMNTRDLLRPGSRGTAGYFAGRGLLQFTHAIPDDLPFPASRWILYDGFDAVVIGREALGRLGEARLLTLRRWMESGGHLVVIDQLMGVEADALLPPGMLAASIGSEPGRGDGTGRVVLTPTADGLAAGFSVMALPGMPMGSVAGGPVGLGWLTVLTNDPGTEREIEELHAIWREVLRMERLVALRHAMSNRTMTWSGYTMGGIQERMQTALNFAATTMDVKPLSAWIVGLLVFAIGLTIAVGTTFGDWFLLRSPRRRRLSFLTTLGWLAGGSLVALLVPMLLRAGETSAIRLQVIDLNEANAGVACSELFALSAGRRQRFTPPAQGPEGWTRRVSTVTGSAAEGLSVASEQFAGNMIGSATASLWTFHAAVSDTAGTVPGIERSALDVGARIEIDPATDEPMLVLRNGLGRIAAEQVFVAFQHDDAVTSADALSGIVSLRVGVPVEDRDRTRHRLGLRSARINNRPHDGFWPRGFVDDSVRFGGRGVDREPYALSGLPGVAMRNASVHSAIGTGRYAAVTMLISRASERIAELDDEQFAQSTDPPGLIERGMTSRWVRVLVPIEESTREALVALYDAGIQEPPAEGAIP